MVLDFGFWGSERLSQFSAFAAGPAQFGWNRDFVMSQHEIAEPEA